jgi:hypothetical protein
LPLSVEILKGTPRDIIKHELGAEPIKTGSILYFECAAIRKKFDALINIVPDNTLIGL